MNKALITICSREKSEKEGLLPAVERYKSKRIEKVFKEAAKEDVSFFILSGEFGLLSAANEIPYYDHLLLPEEVFGLVPEVVEKLRENEIEVVEFYTKLDSKNWQPYNNLMQKAAEEAGAKLEIVELDS